MGINPAANELGITFFFHMASNPTERAICIYRDLTEETSKTAIALALGLSFSVINLHYDAADKLLFEIHKKRSKSGIFALIVRNEIIYIDYTEDLNYREMQIQHNLQLASPFSEEYLYQHCFYGSIKPEDVVFKPLIYTTKPDILMRQLVQTIRPVCNVMESISQ